MSVLGWLTLILSLSFVWGLTIWCYYKVLSAPPEVEEEIAEDLEKFHSA
jgi:hypothetical protein